MTKQVQIRRGTATQHTSFTGAEGEISINTTNDTVHVHDGLAAGGVEMARSDLGNVLAANVAAALAGSTLSSIILTTADINGGTIDSTIIGNTTPAAGNFTSGSFTGNLSFGDNAKAIFGAGSDLQIYHDGSDSYIRDAGTGSLVIQASENLKLQSHTGEFYFQGIRDGASKIYYDNAERLVTTATGIDVTGTVTADGLSVEGTGSEVISVNSTANGSQINFNSATVSDDWIVGVSNDSTDDFLIYQGTAGTGDIRLYTDGDKRFEVNNNGDISFYEDTGTTAKFFWDASAEGLALGQTALLNNGTLTVRGDGKQAIVSQVTNNANSLIQGFNSSTALAFQVTGAGSGYFAGNVGIGVNSPSGTLHSAGGNSNQYIIGQNTLVSGGSSRLQLVNTSDTSGTAGTAQGFQIINNGNDGAVNILNYKSTPMAFWTAGSERARLDASGNWMVGGTTAFGTGTTTINSSGLVYASRSGNKSGHFNRESSDGDIVIFSKDGTTVGSIGSVLGSYLQIGTGDTGVVFQSLVDSIIPHTGSATRDNAISLGTLSGRFKNLYLGGTASISDGTSTGTQTLVGGNYYIANSGAYPIVFQTSGSERARLDVSGNLLVGTTSNNVANQTGTTQGVRIAGGSIKNIQVASTGTTAYFNRLTTDGNIAEFRKNGSPVGAIGVNASTLFQVSSSSTGGLFLADNATNVAGFVNGENAFRPASDNFISLGKTDRRFKDLYLGGGVYLGGTGAANKLDDYEEGTWTPTVQDSSGKVGTWDSTLTGVYTKIGRLVHVSFKITGTGMQLSATGYSRYSGLPFAVAERQSGAWASLAVTSSFGGTTLVDTDESIYLYNSNNAAASSNLIASSFTYYTT